MGKKSRKRRAAKQQAAGDETVRPVKREDNSTHDDKTVSMDKFWDEKAAEMGIAFEKDGDKTKVTIGQNQSFSLSDYEGSVKDGPPLPEQYVAEFLKENKPDCEKALAWCKALAARDLAAGTSMTWDGASVTSESYNYDKTESEPDPEPKQRVNPVLLRLDEKLAKKQQRRHRKKENAKGRPNGTIKKEMSRPGKAPNSVPEPMGLHKTPAVADEMAKKREIHPDVMARVQAASMKLQKAMFGDEGPSKMESNDKKF